MLREYGTFYSGASYSAAGGSRPLACRRCTSKRASLRKRADGQPQQGQQQGQQPPQQGQQQGQQPPQQGQQQGGTTDWGSLFSGNSISNWFKEHGKDLILPGVGLMAGGLLHGDDFNLGHALLYGGGAWAINHFWGDDIRKWFNDKFGTGDNAAAAEKPAASQQTQASREEQARIGQEREGVVQRNTDVYKRYGVDGVNKLAENIMRENPGMDPKAAREQALNTLAESMSAEGGGSQSAEASVDKPAEVPGVAGGEQIAAAPAAEEEEDEINFEGEPAVQKRQATVPPVTPQKEPEPAPVVMKARRPEDTQVKPVQDIGMGITEMSDGTFRTSDGKVFANVQKAGEHASSLETLGILKKQEDSHKESEAAIGKKLVDSRLTGKPVNEVQPEMSTMDDSGLSDSIDKGTESLGRGTVPKAEPAHVDVPDVAPKGGDMEIYDVTGAPLGDMSDAQANEFRKSRGSGV